MANVLALAAPGSTTARWRSAFRGRGAPHRLLAEISDVDAALELLRAGVEPDAILLDVAHVGVKSVAACGGLVASAAVGERGVPVVALAPTLDHEERAELLRAGATGYVLTTIDAESFAIALQAIAEVAGLARDGDGPGGASRADFLRMTGVAAAVAFVAPAVARSRSATDTTPSPSSPLELPTLPEPFEGESDVMRMQRELVRAMGKPVEERRWVMVIDIRKCSGCDACTIACKAENQLPPGVVYRPVVEETIGTYPNVGRRFLPRPCMQCEKPPCTPVCPVGATWRRKDGVIAIDYDKCIGCRYCLTACPYSARSTDGGAFYTESTPGGVQPYEEAVSPEYNAGFSRADHGSPVGNARKCHFCLHRLEAGMLPACVTGCVGMATYFGDANDPDSLVAELIGRPEVRRLKEELGTEPRVYYLT
jgi:Fe-S-cluster-containing dehydrogenase component/DNA-binding NarL/FixJ family response regulator